MKWMSGGAKRQCDRALGQPPRDALVPTQLRPQRRLESKKGVGLAQNKDASWPMP